MPRRYGAKSVKKNKKQNPYVLIFFLSCCGYGGNVALSRPGDRRRADYFPERVHRGASHQQPLEAIAAVVRSPGMETGKRRVAGRGLPRATPDAGTGRPDRVAAGTPPHPRPVPHGASPAGSYSDRHHVVGPLASSVGPHRPATGTPHGIRHLHT